MKVRYIIHAVGGLHFATGHHYTIFVYRKLHEIVSTPKLNLVDRQKWVTSVNSPQTVV